MKARQLDLHVKTRHMLKRKRLESRADGAVAVSDRINAVLMNADGSTSGEIARTLKYSRSIVSEWLKNYDEQGFQGILNGIRSGRKCLLDCEKKSILCDIIDSGPVAYGYISGVWTSPMIADVIANEFAVEYHPGHVRKLLKTFGFSVQRPKRILSRADPVKQDRWTRYTFPRIKKKRKKSTLL